MEAVEFLRPLGYRSYFISWELEPAEGDLIEIADKENINVYKDL